MFFSFTEFIKIAEHWILSFQCTSHKVVTDDRDSVLA